MICHVKRGFLLGLVLLGLGRGAWGLDPHRPLRQYGRQIWQTGEGAGPGGVLGGGLPQNTVHAMAQSGDGFLWLGTDDGLVRFDGMEFKVFTPETTPALGSSAVEGLTTDGAGRLWVVTTAGLSVYRPGRGDFLRVGMEQGLPDAAVRFVRLDRAGRLWVATAGGVCLMEETAVCRAVEGAKGISVAGPGGFAESSAGGAVWLADGAETTRIGGSALKLRTSGGSRILAQMVERDGHLLVGTEEGLQVERGGALVPVAIAGAAGRVAVRAMVQAADGSVWLGTSAGLVRGSGDRFTVFTAKTPLPSLQVQMLFQDREGALWVGTDRGVARVVEGRVEVFPAGDALAGATLLSAMEDREGNVWLGTESDGLTVLRPQRFTTYTTAEGLSGNVVRSVYQDARGTVWVGTDGAGLNRRTAEGFSTLTTKDGLSSDVILALAGGANGDLWVGTPTGLNRIREGTVKVLTTADGLADEFIRSLLVDRAGDVWVGTRHGLTRIHAGAMTTFTAMDGLGSDFIGVMMEARNGDVWIATSGGLTRFHEGRFTNFKVKDGLAKNVVTAIHEDGSGMLWLGESGGGLGRLDPRKDGGMIVPVPATNLPRAISGVLEDGLGRLWIGSRSGIVRVEIAALNRAIETGSGTVALAAYDTTDGMRIRECSSGGHPAAVRMRDGTLWFATLRGVSAVDPAHLDENRVPPLVAMETVLVNDVAQASGVDLDLAPGRQRVEFQYAGLSLVAPQKVEYRYWLEGFDPYWVEAGTHRAAFYTNLRPGRYVFHVAAANNDGVWSEVDATVRLRVRPFFWQTMWFYGLLLLVAALVAYLLYARRVRRVEVQVGARYAGMMDERGRIAREIHDTLAQGIVSISLQLEVVSRLLGSSTEAARAQLDEARKLVRQSLADARSSIWDLRAKGDERGEELPVRAGRALKRLTSSASVQGRLAVTGSYRAMPETVEEELLKIAQEAVTNAVRHAQCSLVEMTLTYEMKRFSLVVKDDGRGFDLTQPGPEGHFGVQGMRERAAGIGARLEVRSEAGHGTAVVVELGLV